MFPRVRMLPNISPISLRIVSLSVNVPNVLRAGGLDIDDSNAADCACRAACIAVTQYACVSKSLVFNISVSISRRNRLCSGMRSGSVLLSSII